MTKLIIQLLEKLTNELKSGNSNITMEDAVKILDLLSPELPTDDAILYLGMSRNKFFDTVVPNIPSKKIRGTKLYKKTDLDKFKNTK